MHTSTHGDIRCDVDRLGGRLPLEPAAGARGPRRENADPRRPTSSCACIGHERLWACGDCVSFPHPRWGRIAIPHWDHALWSGRHVADSILGSHAPYVREPYFFSDIGSLRIQQVGVADAASSSGTSDDGLAVGLDPAGVPACVVLLNAPARLREARELVAAATLCSPATHILRRHIMPVRLIVDPDACIGSAECVALDPEAVELDEHGTARVLVLRARRGARREHLRRLPGRGALDRRVGAELVVARSPRLPESRSRPP